MQKEMISSYQAICIIIFFIFGSSIVMGVSSDTAQDSWLALLLAVPMALPVLLVYARIIKLFPERDLFELIELLFGKIFGKAFILLITWYALHLCALVLRNFSEFVEISIMPETPQLPIMIMMILVVIYMAISGVETMGRWSVGMLPVIYLVVIVMTSLALPKMDFSNLLPVMEHDVKTIASASYKILTFPFGETVLFLCLADAVKRESSPYRIYGYAILISTFVLLVIIFRNTLLLGPEMLRAEYFPSYMAARIVNVGDFMARIEGSITMNFILAGIIKMTVCLIAAAKGMAHLFHLTSYRHIVFPMALLTVALCAIIYDNAMEMFDFLPVYQFYAIPFEIVIPLLIWLFAEKKAHRQKVTAVRQGESIS